MGYKHFIYENIGVAPTFIQDEENGRIYVVSVMDKFIINKFHNGNRINPSQLRRSYIEKHPYVFRYLYIRYDDSESLVETIKRIYRHIEKRPLCIECGKPLPFIKEISNYQLYCSPECQYSSEIQKEKRRNTNIERYGVEHAIMLDEYKEKAKQTSIDRYGSYYLATPLCREQAKEWCRKKYGVDKYQDTDDFKNKVKKTCRKRYGADSPLQSDEIKEKIKMTVYKKYGKFYMTETEHFKEKSIATCKEKYGVEYWCESKMFNEIYKKKLSKEVRFRILFKF